MIKIDDLILKKIDVCDKDKVWEFRQEFIDNNEQIRGHGGLFGCSTYEEWVDNINKYSSKELLPKGMVLTTQFMTIREDDGKVIGLVNVRHSLNEFLLNCGGQIGNCVRPSERNKGYGTKQIMLALEFCKTIGLKKVLITCKKDNKTSEKTIVRNGGILENEVEHEGIYYKRFWITL